MRVDLKTGEKVLVVEEVHEERWWDAGNNGIGIREVDESRGVEEER